MARKIFAIAGKPIMHSASPQLHNAAFAALGMDACCTRLAAASAKEALAIAQEIGISGMSVTAPLKEEMLALVDVLDPGAAAVGAVNTVVLKDGKTVGFNTDPAGVSGSIEAAGIKMKGKKAVVIGAGGAARAAVHALVSMGAGATVANRTKENACALAEKFGCGCCSLGEEELAGVLRDATILVYTASTAERMVQPKLLRKGLAVLDAVYGKKTAISSDAAARGCRVISGRGWLLHQGMKAFEIFTGNKAPIKAMRRAVGNTAKVRKKNIALVGFMGSGKSTVAREIAKMSGMRMIGTDGEIVRKARMPITDVFATKGEAAFRKMEADEIANAVKVKDGVISCGGGAVLDWRNVALLKKNSVIVWLWASPEEIVRRIGMDRDRPLMNRRDRLEAARRILERRRGLYAATADMIVGTEGKKPEEIATLILDETGKTI